MGYDDHFEQESEPGRHQKPYELEAATIRSMQSIQIQLEKGYEDFEQLDDHLIYLNQLYSKLAEIQLEEQRYGLQNNTLPGNIRQVIELLKQLEIVRKTNLGQRS